MTCKENVFEPVLQLDVMNGSSSSLIEYATESTTASSVPLWERPRKLLVLSNTVAGTLHSSSSYRLITCPAPFAFILTLMERKKE